MGRTPSALTYAVTADKRDALDVAHPLEVVVLLGHALEAVHRRVALFRGDARLPLQPRILLQQRAHARVRLGRVGARRRPPPPLASCPARTGAGTCTRLARPQHK